MVIVLNTNTLKEILSAYIVQSDDNTEYAPVSFIINLKLISKVDKKKIYFQLAIQAFER